MLQGQYRRAPGDLSAGSMVTKEMGLTKPLESLTSYQVSGQAQERLHWDLSQSLEDLATGKKPEEKVC